MTKWQRFGDGTWVNVDHVEVIRVEEDDDGAWQLTAAFASGRVHPLGRHDDHDLLVDCTDVLLRGEVGEHLRAVTDTPGETAGAEVTAPRPAAIRRRRWWFRGGDGRTPVKATDAHAESVRPQPAG